MVSPDECPVCHGEMRVLETRPADGYIRRRRRCAECRHLQTTVEVAVDARELRRYLQNATGSVDTGQTT